jgi:hypothetical protein
MAEIIGIVGLVASILQLCDYINAGVKKANELYEAPAEIRTFQVSKNPYKSGHFIDFSS